MLATKFAGLLVAIDLFRHQRTGQEEGQSHQRSLRVAESDDGRTGRYLGRAGSCTWRRKMG
jgi:hypothetical protein